MIIKRRTYLFATMCMMMFFMVYFFENKVRGINEQIETTKETLSRYDEDLKVLESEWSYLNNPKRLSSLAQKIYSDMNSPARMQFTNLKNLPNKEVMFTKADSQIMP